MGDGILGHITKGPVHTKVDALVNHESAQGVFDKRAAFLTALLNAGTVTDYLAFIEPEAGLDPADVNYLRATWYNPSPTGWWSSLQPIYPILRRGLIKAIQAAGTKLLLDSYWLPAPGATTVEVIVCRSTRQVTRIILTPPSPGSMKKRLTNVPMWVVKAKTGPHEQPPYATYDEVVESVDENVVTWQRREFP